jgi:hypothetical protein
VHFLATDTFDWRKSIKRADKWKFLNLRIE